MLHLGLTFVVEAKTGVSAYHPVEFYRGNRILKDYDCNVCTRFF